MLTRGERDGGRCSNTLEEQSANTYVTAKVDGIARSTAGASMCPGRGKSIHGITCMLYETTANFRFATAQVRSALAVVMLVQFQWGGKAASCRVSPESTVP